MFERSKWLSKGMIYLELLLCFALESRLLMCAAEMASSRGGIGGFSGDTHTHISLLSSAELRHLPLHCYPACHFFHVCCTQGVLGCSDIGS